MPMDAVQYKGFYTVTLERPTENKFRVIAQICRNLNGPPVMRNWLPVQEFASERAAYALGLQEARTWIDNTG